MKYVALAAFLILLVGCQQELPSADAPVRVGALLPLTGPVPECGENDLLGIQLALEEINKEKQHIELVVEDTQFNPKMAVSALRKLASEGITLFIGPCSSSSTLAAAPVAEELGVLLFTPNSFAEAITDAGDLIFRGATTPKTEAPVAAQFLLEDLAVQSVGTIYFNNDFGVSYNDRLVSILEASGVAVPVSIPADVPERDFRVSLQKIQDAEVDLLYIVSTPAQIVPAIQQYVEQGMQMPIMVTSLAEDAIVFDAVAGLANEVYFVSYIPELPAFSSRLAAASPGKIPSRDIVQSYMVMQLLGDAVKQCGSDQQCVKAALYRVENQEGLVGSLSIDEHGDVIYPVLFVKEMTGEGFFRVT